MNRTEARKIHARAAAIAEELSRVDLMNAEDQEDSEDTGLERAEQQSPGLEVEKMKP